MLILPPKKNPALMLMLEFNLAKPRQLHELPIDT
jgi:hypothetical protein